MRTRPLPPMVWLASCKIYSCSPSTYSGFEIWVLRFRVLGALFSSLGCSAFEFWVLRFRDLGASCFGLRFRVLRFRNYPTARCQRANHLLKKSEVKFMNTFFTSRKSDFSVENNVVSVYCSYLSMVFPYIGNLKYPHRRTDQQQRFKSKRKISNTVKIALSTFHRTTAHHCCHSMHTFTGSCEKFPYPRYNSWSALLWKYEPGNNRMRTFLKTPVVFSGFVSLALSTPLSRFSLEFRMWSTQRSRQRREWCTSANWTTTSGTSKCYRKPCLRV